MMPGMDTQAHDQKKPVTFTSRAALKIHPNLIQFQFLVRIILLLLSFQNFKTMNLHIFGYLLKFNPITNKHNKLGFLKSPGFLTLDDPMQVQCCSTP